MSQKTKVCDKCEGTGQQVCTGCHGEGKVDIMPSTTAHLPWFKDEVIKLPDKPFGYDDWTRRRKLAAEAILPDMAKILDFYVEGNYVCIRNEKNETKVDVYPLGGLFGCGSWAYDNCFCMITTHGLNVPRWFFDKYKDPNPDKRWYKKFVE